VDVLAGWAQFGGGLRFFVVNSIRGQVEVPSLGIQGSLESDDGVRRGRMDRGI
jgi:hypothetical protein